MTAAFAGMRLLGHLTLEAPRFLALYAVATALYAGASLAVLRGRSLTVPALLATALLMRLPLVGSAPSLSADVWRYLWSGHVALRGVNPYLHAVDSPALDALATPFRALVDHAWMSTPYPPVAQVLFTAVTSLWPGSPAAFQLAAVAFDLAAVLAIARLLVRLERPPSWAILYAWSPLAVVESSHGAHVESAAVALLVLGLVFVLDGRRALAGAALAAAILVKVTPFVVLPAVGRRLGVAGWAAAALVAAVATAPFAAAGTGLAPGDPVGTGLLGALAIYLRQWQTNAGLFGWLARALWGLTADPVAAARLVAATVLGLAALRVVRRTGPGAEAGEVVWGVALLYGAFLALAPAVFPWYVLPQVALAPAIIGRSRASTRFAVAWLVFAATVDLSYLFYVVPSAPAEVEWVRAAEYVPLWALLSLAALAAWRPSWAVRART